ncbi:MAG: hypothetical protein KF802_13105 [Bdellovibrionaceae bacterium]|nr:hypothetical protein [Pseudobdellovibrionaceae bacterium]
MNEKLLGLFLLVCAIGISWYLGQEGSSPHPQQEPQGLAGFISEDLSQNDQQGLLPKEWRSIHSVNYSFENERQKQLLNINNIRIPKNPQGQYQLDVDVIDVPDEENPSIILQMSLSDLKSKNKIWELGRFYSLVPYLSAEKAPEKNIPTKTESEK